MISLKNVDKYFFRHKKNEIHVINDTSLELGDTGLVALLGPSGSGKTTLLNAIGGLDKINSGSIYIDGQKMPKVGNYRKDRMRVLNIGYIFQDYNLLDNLTVFDNVALSLKMIGIKSSKEIKRRVDYILELVGMYRYRNKPAGNLSGGQRQRVGIARALVKNPEVIIADEPTGNLDSRNTIEIMNIIKRISQDKLVILVTHEKDLAHFYASRIVNLVDGKIVSDEMNEHENELDYRIDNKIYLKDFENIEKVTSESHAMTVYSDAKEKLKLDIVVKNGNIYIKTHGKEKIEVVDEDAGIEFVNGHYEKIKKEDYEDSKFDFSKLNNDRGLRYTSIYNVFTMLKTGFKKVVGYPLMKKILLFGFFFSAMFIIYALSSIFGVTDIEDADFLNAHRDYIVIKTKENRPEDFAKIESMRGVKYAIPGDSQVSIDISNEELLQLVGETRKLTGSLAGTELLESGNIVYGRMPEKANEIVLDKRVIDAAKVNDVTIEWLNIHTYEDYVGLKASVRGQEYEIVGVSDTEDPCIYFDESKFFDVIAASPKNEFSYDPSIVLDSSAVQSYDVYANHITLKEGKIPSGDYEVIINASNAYSMPIGSLLDVKVNGQKLKVVGHYTSSEGVNEYIVSANTFKYETIIQNANLLIIADDKEAMISELKAKGYEAIDNYTVLKEKYIESIKDNIIESLVLAGILLAVSFIEIFLMIRASFLSRIKEVGIYRAIGVKKTDIYKMFLGEILVITTLAGLPGAVFMGAIMKELLKVPLFTMYKMNNAILIFGIILVYLLNIIVGLMPIRATIRKTPAEILSRNDVD